MRVGILAIQHESNTFIRTPTDLERFRQVVLETGPGMRERFDTAHHEVGGEANKCVCGPILRARTCRRRAAEWNRNAWLFAPKTSDTGIAGEREGGQGWK